MKKHLSSSLLLASFLILLSLHGVHAAGSASISGDEVCGATASTTCDFSHLKIIVQNVLVTLVSVGASALVVFAIFRLLQAEVAVRQGNPGARMQALKNIFNGLIGLLIIVGVLGGFFMLALQLFGTQAWTTGIFRLLSDVFVEHAYAADERLLPNPIGAYNIFDLILAALGLIVKFFIYPAVVALWVWSGFQFVFSQGNPEGLKKAKNWLLWSFLITVIMFTLQGFTLALRNTMTRIAPQSAALIEQPQAQQGVQQVTRDPNAPADGQLGSACATASGGNGVRGTDGSCTSRSDSYAGQPVTSCNGQNDGTPCTVSGKRGTCTMSDSSESSGGVFGCYVTPGQ